MTIPLRKTLRLSSAAAAAAAVLLYSAIAHVFLAPPVVTIPPEQGASVFLSTDVDTSLRPSLEKAILNAKQSVLLIIYSLSDPSIIHALRRVSQQGVSVTVIHDPVETPDARILLGKEVSCYPRRGRGLMHNKLLVIDHELVWIGSANMSTRSLTEQGNLVVGLKSPFFAAAIEELSSAMISQTPLQSPPATMENALSRWTLYFHPYHGKESLQALVSRIENASRRVFVAMFTFTHPDLVFALCQAKRRGVDVRVVFDQESARQTSRNAFVRLKRNGIPCGYRIKRDLLHYKAALIDDLLVAGSCNWTRAGFFLNHEALLFIDPIPSCHKDWIERWWNTVERTSSMTASLPEHA